MLCMCVFLPAYVHKSAKYQPSPEEGAGSPGAGAMGGCEPPDMGVGN